MKILVTGSAGFIGFFLTKQLMVEGHEVVGVDSFNNYYDVKLKMYRNETLMRIPASYTSYRADISDKVRMESLFDHHKFDAVINLAAQAGVRFSIENPGSYIKSNLDGFANILEMCRNYDVKHLIYASSSSVYGINAKVPFSESDNVDHPVSLYAATKKSNELLAHSYSDLYDLPCTGLRFFTVYGPAGRPDMAYYKFTKAIFEGQPIDVYNNGEMKRDFTYVDDIVNAIVKLVDHVPVKNPDWDRMAMDPATSRAPYRIYNIGNNNPVNLMTFIETIEKHVGKKAEKNFLPMQPGDVPMTYADITSLNEAVGYTPTTDIETGLAKFVEWYRGYYNC